MVLVRRAIATLLMLVLACARSPAVTESVPSEQAGPAPADASAAPSRTSSEVDAPPRGPTHDTASPPPATNDADEPATDEMTSARIAAAEVQAKVLESAAAQFVIANGKCPASLAALATAGLVPEVPRDPWDGEYRLECKNDGDILLVVSAGPDRTPATADDVDSKL